MKQLVKIVSVSVTILLIILASCSVAFASSPTVVFPMGLQRPEVTENSGYIELLYENSNNGYFTASVITWNFTPSSSNNEPVGSTKLNISLDYDSSYFYFKASSDPGTNGFVGLTYFKYGAGASFNNFFVTSTDLSGLYFPHPSGCKLVSVRVYGQYSDFGNLNDLTNGDIFISYADTAALSSDLVKILNKLNLIAELLDNDSYSSQLYSILEELYDINFNTQNSDATLSDIKQNLTTKLMQLYNLGQTMLGELEKISSNTDQLDDWLEEINLRLGTLYAGITDVSSWLSALDNQLFELKGFLYEMWLVDLDSNSKLYEIVDTLNAILSNLEAYADVKFPEHNGSNVDELVSKEDELLDDSEVDVSDALDVQVNPEAMTSVLGMVERVFNLHPKIIGLIVTILGLGLIALILGR